MEHVVETVAIVAASVVCQSIALLGALAIDQNYLLDAVYRGVPKRELKLPGKLFVRREAVVEKRVFAGRQPATPHFLEIVRGDFVQTKAKLRRDVRDVPKDVSEFFPDLLLKPDVVWTIAQVLLVLADKSTDLAHHAE